MNKLHAFMMIHMRSIMDIKWEDKVTNIKVLKRTELPSMEDIIRKKNFRWTGHLLRMPTNHLPRQVLYQGLSYVSEIMLFALNHIYTGYFNREISPDSSGLAAALTFKFVYTPDIVSKFMVSSSKLLGIQEDVISAFTNTSTVQKQLHQVVIRTICFRS